jgi:hypothetical protein
MVLLMVIHDDKNMRKFSGSPGPLQEVLTRVFSRTVPAHL